MRRSEFHKPEAISTCSNSRPALREKNGPVFSRLGQGVGGGGGAEGGRRKNRVIFSDAVEHLNPRVPPLYRIFGTGGPRGSLSCSVPARRTAVGFV